MLFGYRYLFFLGGMVDVLRYIKDYKISINEKYNLCDCFKFFINLFVMVNK